MRALGCGESKRLAGLQRANLASVAGGRMKTTLITAIVVITLAAPPFLAQEPDPVQVHASVIDVEAFLSGERSVPLSEPTVAIEP